MSVKTDKGHWYQHPEVWGGLALVIIIATPIVITSLLPEKPPAPRTYTAQTIVLKDGTTHNCHDVQYSSDTKGWKCLNGQEEQVGWYPIDTVARIERHTFTVRTASPTPRTT